MKRNTPLQLKCANFWGLEMSKNKQRTVQEASSTKVRFQAEIIDFIVSINVPSS